MPHSGNNAPESRIQNSESKAVVLDIVGTEIELKDNDHWWGAAHMVWTLLLVVLA